MSKRGARVPSFSRFLAWSKIKGWYKSKVHRANRKRIRQSLDVGEHSDKRLDPRALD